MALKPNKTEIAPHSYVQIVNEGSEFYSDINLTHHAIGQTALPLVLEAVESITIKTGSVFTIVDYGTADGGISMNIIYACVKAIREKYGEELPINVIYEDQPVNDFKSLFMRVHGLLPGPPSFVKDFANVFVMASGTSFYSQCFPNDSVTLGISTCAMHWLRDKPCDISDSLVPDCSTVSEGKEKFRQQAEKDWELILLNRAAELMPGGRMVLVLALSLGNVRNYPKSHWIWIFIALWNILKSLADEGIVTKEELKSTNLVVKLRTLEELNKPFQTNSSVNQAGLELVSIETLAVPCRFHQKWMEEKGDAKEHAKKFVASVRTWSRSTFLAGLSNSRSAREKEEIIEEIYHRYEAEVAEHPENHGMQSSQANVVIRKRP